MTVKKKKEKKKKKSERDVINLSVQITSGDEINMSSPF